MMHNNTPDLWRSKLPCPNPDGHKYDRGHSVIIGSNKMTGAAVLASESCMRIGSGLCSVILKEYDRPLSYVFQPHIIVETISLWGDIHNILEDKRKNTVLAGPGLADFKKDKLQKLVIDLLALKRKYVLDASALTAFEGNSEKLFTAIQSETVLTPHAGEFQKLFPDLSTDKYGVIEAAQRANCIVLLKGRETIIARQDGQCVVCAHSSPYLATAGSGDVLAGMITGLIAQGMSTFNSACAATWIHGECALKFGPGLVSNDLHKTIPEVLKAISQ